MSNPITTRSEDDLDWDAAFEAPTGPSARPRLPAPPPDAGAGPSADAGPAPLFDSLEAWVNGYLAQIIEVEIGPGMRWCPQWWRHAGAIARLEALWRAWEHLRLSDDPTAVSVWWRDHADYHLTALMEGTRSPFRQCSADGHRDDLQPLPVEPAPPGWFGESGA